MGMTRTWSAILVSLFIIVVIWQGWGIALKFVIGLSVALTLLVSSIVSLTRLGNGLGAALVLMTILLTLGAAIAGILARTAAGTLSNLTYVLVALAGTLVGHNAGGGLVTLAITVTTVVVSKQALARDRRQRFLYTRSQ